VRRRVGQRASAKKFERQGQDWILDHVIKSKEPRPEPKKMTRARFAPHKPRTTPIERQMRPTQGAREAAICLLTYEPEYVIQGSSQRVTRQC
jgi:hypothetical protein